MELLLEGLSWSRKILGACCLENAFNEGEFWSSGVVLLMFSEERM